ncbi:hypothetical protein MKI84_01185 [Ancylobacter sp. A5.8]|uniref:hypothetical protein n=1 Tax=Ancylobacter gelatini TaxID=2919920 RepID=UPI001F4E4E29|nr:hypothetical protein [Ancylobacter gelatini]MCJ8141526.1 hypothetical protein [Ancylobacter gelatini]
MPVLNAFSSPRNRAARSLFAAAALAALALAAPANAQSSAVMKQCSERWNEMKAKDQTGDLTYRQFFQQCTANAAPSSAPAPKPATSTPAASATPATGGASAKDCAARWNDMKAKDQTGDLTYREFSQSCMAGTAPKGAATGSRTSVPSAGAKPLATEKPAPAKPAPKPAAAREEQDSESDKAALTRCNAQWQDYKARNNLSGAKAWHVFMAKCL